MARRFLSFFSRSIRGRLTLLVAAVLVPATVLVSWLILQSYRNERRALERHLTGAAHATSLLVDATLAERQALLHGLATSGRLQRNDLEGFRVQADAVVKSEHEWIVLGDQSGHQIINTAVPAGVTLPRGEPDREFLTAVQGNQAYVSNLRVGTASRRHLVFTAVPVVLGGELRYTLSVAMAPAVFDEAMRDGGAGESWVVSIIDREGTVVARTRRAGEFVGRKASDRMQALIRDRAEGVVESTTLDGVDSITGFVRSPTTGWTVVIASPAGDLFASAEQLLLVALGVSLVFCGMAALVAWWAGRGVVSAVQTLVAETGAVGRGEVLQGGATGMAETDIVSRALADTSSQLASREQELVRANQSLTATAVALREKQERLDAARTAAATGTFVWQIASGAFEADESLNALLAIHESGGPRLLADFIALLHEDDRARVRDTMERCAVQAADFASEFRVVRGDGANRWLSVRGKITTGPAGDTMAAGCVDITERRQAVTDIARARDAAVAAARAKDEFLAALSHELRTPLNPVLLVASDAAQHPDYPLAAREAFAMIAKNATLEARLIDDLLDLTRITQGKLSLELRPLELHAALREAIATIRAEVDGKYQTLELALEAENSTVKGDSTRLQQVFWNLLKNAVKFTPGYGRIGVSSRTVGGSIEIEISDTGIGMTEDEMARSFKTFSQGDHAVNGSSHRFGGLGLGLSISRMLVEMHSGRIAVRSEGRGHGATFTVQLPLVEPAAAPGGAGAPGAVDTGVAQIGRGIRLLLVEDHDATRVTIGRLLGRRGYNVKVAATSAEALRLAAENVFDLVVSDIGLPDADGYTLMQHLRDRYGMRGVALTGYGMEDDIERGRAAGFVAHLTKPVDVSKLTTVLIRVQPNGDGSGRAG